MITKIDERLLMAALWLMKRLGRYLGATVPGTVRALAIAVAVVSIIGAVQESITRYLTFSIGVCLFIDVFMFVPTLMILAKESEKWPNRVMFESIFTRVFTLFLAVSVIIVPSFTVWGISQEFMWILYVTGLYVAACPPAPPKEKREPLLAKTAFMSGGA